MVFKETDQYVNVAIVGGGFCGILTAIHLLRDKESQLHVHLINKDGTLTKGVAYNPHTASLLLNVPNGRMSAFDDVPDDYVQWLLKNYPQEKNKTNLAAAFSSRQQYGEYLACLWAETCSRPGANKQISIYNQRADDIVEDAGLLHIHLEDNSVVKAKAIILATGNRLPRLPDGIHPYFKNSSYYFGDPWDSACVNHTNNESDILVIGNGLTMVDTVTGLVENGFKGNIYTVSPHGYRLRPSTDAKAPYTGLNPAKIADTSLLNLVKTLNKHRKIAEGLNQSPYPLIDALRPHSQKLWQSFSLNEKRQFTRYLRFFWDNIRHRLPVELYNLINDMRNSGQLITQKGQITAITETGCGLEVTLNCCGSLKPISVQRIINCTGPETDINQPGNELLNNLVKKGMINAGPCGIGINAQPENGRVITDRHLQQPHLFIIGGNLKGVLWESTAVPELRAQAKNIAGHLLTVICTQQGHIIEPV